MVLVIGPHNWHLPHYAGLAGTAALIFAGRKAITATFGWSINRQQSNLNKLQTQRETKITELKKATRYDSTQELLQKYGGAPPQPKIDEKKPAGKKEAQDQRVQQVQRTGLPPPPTANIPGRTPTVQSIIPPSRNATLSPPSPQDLVQSPVSTEEPGFAPNAFSQPLPLSSTGHDIERHWYDRIFDLVLGEDESLAKNRLVLMCQQCRLVNGQAPPGVRTLEELGKWRCQSCGVWNGSQADAAKVIKEIALTPTSPKVEPVEEENVASSHEDHVIEDHEGTTGRDEDENDSGISRRVTRSAGKAESEGL